MQSTGMRTTSLRWHHRNGDAGADGDAYASTEIIAPYVHLAFIRAIP
jgi:hypothetical protein